MVKRQNDPPTQKGAASGRATTDHQRVHVARSGIHGRGVFASRRFRKGATIGVFEGVPTKRNGPHVLWVPTDDGGWEGRRGTNALRHVNHSSEPNAVFVDWDLKALRTIEAGEEITVDYGEDAP